MRASAEKNPIVLLGAGGHARACIDVIEQVGHFQVAGLIGLPREMGTFVMGYPVIGTEEELHPILQRCSFGIVTVGQIKSSAVRVRLFELLSSYGRSSPPIISPSAYVSPHAEVGDGSIVMHGAIVNAAARVGRNCIVNSMALVEHDVVIGDHCHIATGARVNGGAEIGDRTFLGSGCVIKQEVRVGRQCVVGIGAIVRNDCADAEVIVESK